MKLVSVLRVMDDEDEVYITDINAPIDRCNLYRGAVQGALKYGKIRNGLVQAICAVGDTLSIAIDIEYQKSHRRE